MTKPIESVSLSECFTPQTMWQVAGYRSLQDFLRDCRLGVSSAEELEALPDKSKLDAFVAERTQFATWNDFRRYAVRRYFGEI